MLLLLFGVGGGGGGDGGIVMCGRDVGEADADAVICARILGKCSKLMPMKCVAQEFSVD